MDRVHYAGGSILTGTAIAHVLVDYAEALAQAGSAGTVVVPTVTPTGEAGESHILVGPSSQMLTVDEHSDTADPVDEEWLAHYRAESARLRRLGSPESVAVTDEGDGPPDWIVHDLDPE